MQLEQYNDILDSICRKIFNGNAVLFVGAGFSRDAIGFEGKMPMSKELKNIIFSLMGDAGDDTEQLDTVADYFINSFCKENPNKLDEFIKKMKNMFTVRANGIQKHHIDIISAPWKHIYTTNYDDVIEQSAKNTDIRVDSFDLDDLVKTNEKYCLHINGKIDKLDKETLSNGKFRLTHSSYISGDYFNKSNWKHVFTNDLEISSVIVFVGYSLYE